ncbi:ATP-binding protein [Dactylosporangium sp. CA-233914]|uniref:sensor histidine kinase n=1 Tax=Dactylosporangium sp. CA-233914 TaxID=3239934 RepID=UPI003D8E6A78
MPIDAAPSRRPRFLLALLLPVAGLLALAGVAAYAYAGQNGRLADPRPAIAAGVAADTAATALGAERYAAARVLLSGTGEAKVALQEKIAAADPALRDLRARAAAAGLLTPALVAELDALGDLRTRAAAGSPGVGAGEFLLQYTQLIADVVELRQDTTRRPAPPSVAAAARASGWLAVAREQLAQIQLLDLRGDDTPAWHESLAAHQAAHLDALRRFGESVPPAWRDRLARVPSGLAGDAQPALDALSTLAASAGADEAALARAARDEQNRTLIAGLVAVLALVAASIALAVRTARTPRRVAPVLLDVDSDIHVVREEAARAVAEQAALRAGTSAAVIGLARRSQHLADELVHHLDAAERDEADPDRLAQLFALDHLATRIRRDNQSLLVLTGADTSVGRRDPVTLLDLVRAAQSRIEDYPRIEYVRVAADVHIAPEAVDDVVHLLAELFDNATRNGPPDRPVLVEARRAGAGAVIEIADRGPGLPAPALAEHNARLADPPPLDAAEAHRLGFAVVARLAARHGLTVTLRPPPSGRGLRAIVQLPPALVLSAPLPAVDPPVVRRLPPRPFERGQALPGGEPVDVPHPRSTLVPVVRGPVRTPDGPTVDLEPEAVRDLLTGYQQAATPHPVTAATNTEGPPAA